MDDCNWNWELIQYFWKKGRPQVLVSRKHSTLENTRSLQVTSWEIEGTTQMYGCKCSFKITVRLKQKYLPNSLHVRNSWLQVLFWKIPYPLRNGWPQLLSSNKKTLTLYSEKNLFPAIKHSNLQGKIVLWITAFSYELLFH